MTTNARRFMVPQFTLRRLLVAMALFGLWMGDCLSAVQRRAGVVQRIGDEPGRPSFYLRGCVDSLWFRRVRSATPIGWRMFGAEPIWMIHLDADEYSQADAIEIARLFPEGEVFLDSDTQHGEQVLWKRTAQETDAKRGQSLFTWWWEKWWIAQW